MTKHVSQSILSQIHQIQQGLANGGFDEGTVRAALQSIIEKRPFGDSSLSCKIIDVREGVTITQEFLAQTMEFRGQLLKRHRNGGGWVPAEQDEHDESKPFVAETAYVGPFAMVFDNARVYDNAGVAGKAQVSGRAQVYGNARIFGNARAYTRARIFGDAQVAGNAQVGKAQVSGRAMVLGYVAGNACISGDTCIHDRARVHGETISGYTRVMAE